LSDAVQAQRTDPMPRAVVTRGRPRHTGAPSDQGAPAKRRGRPPGSLSKNPRLPTKAPERNGDGEADNAIEWWVPGWKERV
jgi:hypothetical protein